jgi:YD repeat-containing protein
MKRTIIYNTYDEGTGNLLNLTGPDGIPVTYEWDASAPNNRNYQTGVIKNPGSSSVQHAQYATHKPLVGVTRTTDENGIMSNFEYDSFGNLLLEKDNDNQITKRYRINVIGDNQFNLDFSINGNPIPGQTVTFSFVDNKTIGSTKYTWDFGDGQVLENSGSSVTHSYASTGQYSVKLIKLNPEYQPLTITKSYSINGPPTITLSSTSSTYDLCNPPPNFAITARAIGGCGGNTFKWSKRFNSGAWTDFTDGFQIPFTGAAVGTYTFKCTVTDSCGQVVGTISNLTIDATKSIPNCAQP